MKVIEAAAAHLGTAVPGSPALLAAFPGGDARTGLSTLISLILVLLCGAVLLAVFFIYRHTVGKMRRTTLMEDYRKEAEAYEKSGKFVSAAVLYESHLKEREKAAELYERGGDYRQAASLYDLLGMSGKAKEMYRECGDFESAAEVSVLEGDYEEAAKLYHSAGKKIDAATMLERAGRKLAAVRLYRESGEYRKAAQLLDEEGMLREAAEMFGIPLRDKQIGDCIDEFYAYALKLERAGERQAALEVFRAIDRSDPLYRDVKERLGALAPSAAGEEERVQGTTLRSFIRGSRIEPKYALKLWIHILKALQEGYRAGRACGSLSPDTIVIDARNAISFLPQSVSPVYVSPEALKGEKPDACSDIYSAGIILYEMLMGNLEGLGSARVSDAVEDVPEWLDEIVLRCIRKVRQDRYSGIETVFSDMKNLSEKRRGSTGPK
ncbi:MAG: hypothetical protein M1497_04785 [Nitrospirae bacterium]|nr:hypothetical protein [Nitrospirota bacterium]